MLSLSKRGTTSDYVKFNIRFDKLSMTINL